MDKENVINQIIDMQRRMSQVLLPFALHAWRESAVPLSQLKSLLIITSKNGTNYRTLAQDLGVTPGDVTGLVQRLVTQGLVIRQPNPKDRRIVLLQASDKGRELLVNLMESQTQHTIRILKYMSMSELQSLSQGLAGVIHAVEEHQKEFS
jgi:DNA-binding MarR family transcriptional regulator